MNKKPVFEIGDVVEVINLSKEPVFEIGDVVEVINLSKEPVFEIGDVYCMNKNPIFEIGDVVEVINLSKEYAQPSGVKVGDVGTVMRHGNLENVYYLRFNLGDDHMKKPFIDSELRLVTRDTTVGSFVSI